MKKRILFFGTPHIAVPSLQTLAQLPEYEIVGVGVFPDRPVGRKQVLTPCPVKIAAQALDVSIYEIGNKAELIEVFNTVPHDLSLVIAFGMIFPATVLNHTQLGVVNVHFSLLPQYRGASPVQAAILDGKLESGITWQRMVSALDAGDILWQKPASIKNQTTAEVWQAFAKLAAQEMPAFLAAYTQHKITPQPQTENQATFCRKFTKADGQLDPRVLTAAQIYNTWRAFQPWPGVSVATPAGNLKLHQISLTAAPEGLALTAADQKSVWVTHAQLPGKTVQPIQDILRGHPNLFL